MKNQIHDFINFLVTLSPKKIINYLKLYLSFHFSQKTKKYFFAGLPATLMVEPTTACNLGCSECVAGVKNFTRQTGSMEVENFKKYINDLSDNLLYLMLYFQGEPMIHPFLSEMINYAKRKNIYSCVSTNGHFLTPENAEKIILSGLHRLIISIDGITQESYFKYRKGGNLNQVVEGINNLIFAKKKFNVPTPYLIIQFIIFKHNESEVSELNDFIKPWAGEVSLQLKSAQVYDYKNGNNLIPATKRFSRYLQTGNGGYELKNRKRNDSGCWKMWHTMVLT